MVIIGQKTLGEKLGIKASVLNADGREDGLEMEGTDGDVDEPNAGAVLRVACCGWQWLSRRSDRAAARQVTWTMTPH